MGFDGRFVFIDELRLMDVEQTHLQEALNGHRR